MVAPRARGGRKLRGYRRRVLPIAAAFAVVAAGLTTTWAGTASAQANSVAGILGQAGPNSTANRLAVVGLRRINSSNAVVNGSGAVPGPGTFTLNSPPSLWANPGHVYTGSGVTVSGLPVTPPPSLVRDDPLTAQIGADALAGSDAFRELPPTETVPGNAITGTLTLTGHRGLNVLDLTRIYEKGGDVLTFTGPPGTQWVVNVSGSFENYNASIVVAGGVVPAGIVFNVYNVGIVPSLQVVVGAGGGGEAGILLAPHATFSVGGSYADGILIGADVTLQRGIVVNAPPREIPTPTIGMLLQSAVSQSFSSQVAVGEPVHAAAWVVGGNPGGAVEFRYYSGSTPQEALAACQADLTAFSEGASPHGGFVVSSEEVPVSLYVVSPAVVFDAPGIFYWAAFYSPVSTDIHPAASSCVPLVVTAAQSGTSTASH